MIEIEEKVIKYQARDGKIFKDKDKCESYDVHLRNLYDETVKELMQHKKEINEIDFISCGGVLIDKDTFFDCAREVWYDNGFGSQSINETLLIVGKDWWLERAEYDGSEWWEYKEKPNKMDYNIEIFDKEKIDKILRS